jgi:hypothetical protein
MDPYLEAHWRDVHASLVIYIRDALQDQLPRELRARVEERVVLETPEGLTGGLFPDVRVVEFPTRPVAGATGQGGTTVAEPIIIDAEAGPLTEGFIQIIDSGSGNQVVTVIEVLSPSNKLPGPDREQYQRKQQELVRSDTNLVEIDLLRQGQHVAAVARQHIPADRRTPFPVCVRRAVNRGKAEVYPIRLQEALPVVKVPLRPQDADVLLDLPALVQQVYQRGRYEGDLDYSKAAEPPLGGPDAQWAEQWLRQKGLRPASRRKPPTPNKP